MTAATTSAPSTSPTSASPLPWIATLLAAIIAAVFILKIPPLAHPWPQGYDPTGHWWLSALVAALPVVVLLGTLALLHMKAHYAALLGLATSLLCAILLFGMPASLAAKTAVLGAGYGLLPIGWIILNAIFMYQLTCEAGLFKVLQESLAGITQDRRLQLLLIAFSFGAFFEGAAGFGTPVAITAAVLIGLGFKPLQASGLSLIANTAPVAFGALGTPLVALQGVTGLDLRELSAQAGRILPFFSVLVPFWLVWAFAGFQGMLEVWPAVLVAGVFFAIPQFLMSNFHGPWLVDIVAAVVSMFALIIFLLKWQPKRIWGFENETDRAARGAHGHTRAHGHTGPDGRTRPRGHTRPCGHSRARGGTAQAGRAADLVPGRPAGVGQERFHHAGQGAAYARRTAVPGRGRRQRHSVAASGGLRLDAVRGPAPALAGARREARRGQP